MDIQDVILKAKLGVTRKDAQIDTCSVFSAALYDVLTKRGIACEVYTASFHYSDFKNCEWSHSVLKVGERYFDSMGEFSVQKVGERLKIHPKVKFRIEFKKDVRDFDSEFELMHEFYIKKIAKSFETAFKSYREVQVAETVEIDAPGMR